MNAMVLSGSHKPHHTHGHNDTIRVTQTPPPAGSRNPQHNHKRKYQGPTIPSTIMNTMILLVPHKPHHTHEHEYQGHTNPTILMNTMILSGSHKPHPTRVRKYQGPTNPTTIMNTMILPGSHKPHHNHEHNDTARVRQTPPHS